MKKYLIAALAAVAVFAISAFAASLQVNAGTLQAGDDAIAQCLSGDPGDHVTVTYGDATFTNPGWTIQEITLDDGDQCTGLTYSVVITGGSAPTSTVTGAFVTGDDIVDFGTGFDAEAATDVHLVIRSAA